MNSSIGWNLTPLVLEESFGDVTKKGRTVAASQSLPLVEK